MKKGDYIVAKCGEKLSPRLLLIRKAKTSPMVCVVPDKLMGTEDELVFRIEESDIVAYLGENPSPGSVYGVRVEPLYRKDLVKYWGFVYVYVQKSKEDLQDFYSKLSKWGKRLAKKGHIYPFFDTELRPKRGRWAGTYRYRPKDENDLITFHTDDLNHADELVTHELGHGVWFRKMSEKARVKWIKLYHKSVEIHKAEQDKVDRILSNLRSYTDATIEDFCSELDESEQEIVWSIVDHISTVHHLKQKHIDALLISGESISNLLPKAQDIEFGKPNPIVTEYGGVSPEELFAESFQLWCRKRDLNPRVKKEMIKTLKGITGE